MWSCLHEPPGHLNPLRWDCPEEESNFVYHAQLSTSYYFSLKREAEFLKFIIYFITFKTPDDGQIHKTDDLKCATPLIESTELHKNDLFGEADKSRITAPHWMLHCSSTCWNLWGLHKMLAKFKHLLILNTFWQIFPLLILYCHWVIPDCLRFPHSYKCHIHWHQNLRKILVQFSCHLLFLHTGSWKRSLR